VNARLLKGFFYLESGGEVSFHDSFVLLAQTSIWDRTAHSF